MLRARAEFLGAVRAFFERRGVLEVDTPLLRPASVPDPAIAPLRVPGHGWLQTSPELAMKTLLASGSGDIYQLNHVFREGEHGRLHQPEFTMIEWYRVGWELGALIDETLALIDMALRDAPPVNRMDWAALLNTVFGCDAFDAADAELAAAAAVQIGEVDADLERGALLDLMYAHAVERLGDGLLVVENFPPAQAALARIERHQGRSVARRFEVACGGVELANGYLELTDAAEQRRRFAHELEQRAAGGQPVMDLDETFLAALELGMPDCSGVAVGFDRLLMLRTGASAIDAVMPFAKGSA